MAIIITGKRRGMPHIWRMFLNRARKWLAFVGLVALAIGIGYVIATHGGK